MLCVVAVPGRTSTSFCATSYPVFSTQTVCLPGLRCPVYGRPADGANLAMVDEHVGARNVGHTSIQPRKCSSDIAM